MRHFAVSINVFRIYLSRTWRNSGQVERLLAEFDRFSRFLYRIDAIVPGDGNEAATDCSENRIRIAMTQAHVVLAWGAGIEGCTPEFEIERRLAHSGFRRRIPLLVVDGTGARVEAGGATRADLVVGFDPGTIVSVIQGLAEDASTKWKREQQRVLDAIDASAGSKAALEATRCPSEAPRLLPVEEIAAAYYQRQRTRRDPAASGSR